MTRHTQPPKNIGVLFDWHATRSRTTETHLDRPFDIAPDGGTRYDATALADLVRTASAWLHAAGVRRGDRIAVIKRNHFDFVLLAAAAARIGALAATISAANRPRHLAEMLSKLRPVLTVTSTEVLRDAAGQGVELTRTGTLLLLDGDRESAPADALLVTDLRDAAVPAVDLRADDEPMMITHTSGTTDTPKLVVHTADTCRAGTRLELLPLPFAVNGSRDVALSSISFAHSRAFAWAAAQLRWAPSRLVVASSHHVDDVERVLETHRPTTIEATPNVFQHWIPLVQRRPELFTQVRYYMNTFDMMHPSIARPFLGASRRKNVMWAHSWGQSEVGPIAGSAYTRRRIQALAGSTSDSMNMMGWAWPGLVRARVVDPETNRPVPQGTTGVIMVRAASVCVDYLGDSDRYDAKRSGAWWNTGDVGYLDRLGRIHFVDRAVDRIEGTSATELESVLLERVPGATEVVLLSRTGRRPVPVVCVDDGLDPQVWRDVTTDLPALDDPVVLSWADLPRTSTWKIRRKELREKLFAGQDDTVLDERWI